MLNCRPPWSYGRETSSEAQASRTTSFSLIEEVRFNQPPNSGSDFLAEDGATA